MTVRSATCCWTTAQSSLTAVFGMIDPLPDEELHRVTEGISSRRGVGGSTILHTAVRNRLKSGPDAVARYPTEHEKEHTKPTSAMPNGPASKPFSTHHPEKTTRRPHASTNCA